MIANEGNCPKHIIVAHKNYLFSLDVYHPVDNNLLNISEMYEIFERLIKTYANKETDIGIGALTGDERDTWADVYKTFMFT
jgi:hypothetical protein